MTPPDVVHADGTRGILCPFCGAPILLGADIYGHAAPGEADANELRRLATGHKCAN